MSLRYHFRGDDADQLRAMRAGAALALAQAHDAATDAVNRTAPVSRARQALAAAVQAFPALALRPAGATSPGPPRAREQQPAEALAAAWDDLDGDGTPWSYLCASVLRRELESALSLNPPAVGAVELPPWRAQALADEEPPWTAGCSWRTVAPADWRLLVMEDTRRVLVRFLTTAPPDGPAVLLHEDWYRRAEGYEARAAVQSLAHWGDATAGSDGAAASTPR